MKSSSHKFQPLDLTLQEKFKKIIPNGTLSGTTWDAYHLDSFLKTNTQNYKAEYFIKKKKLLENKNLTLLSTGSNKSKESCIFRAKPRFTETCNDSSFNNFHQFYSELNALALTQADANLIKIENLPTIEDAYAQKAQVKEFKDSKLEPVKFPPANLSTSKEKRNELFDLQKNRKEYSKWKKELANLTKARRIVRNGFRSGALNFDHPLNNDSFYYKDVGQQLKKKNQIHILNQEKHRIYIDEHNKTNENIGFSNRNALNRSKSENKIYDEKNHKNIDDFWKCKKKNSIFTKRSKVSADRIFGTENEKYFLERAEFLKDADTRQKKYNIITHNTYEPEVDCKNFKKIRNKHLEDFYFKN